MYGLLSKIAIIIAATFLATSMPNYINDNVDGFVPSDETVSKHLRIDTASVSSQVSSMGTNNDLTSDALEENDKVSGSQEEKNEAYNEKSGKVLGAVSDKAIENENPIISCNSLEANCDNDLKVTPTNKPTTTPVAKVTPTPSLSATPTPIFPNPTVTIKPLPSKYPTLYPCPPIPIEGSDTRVDMPCIY